MWKKILISGAVGAAILGAGGTALAASGSSSPAPNPKATSVGSSSTSDHAKAKDAGRAILKHTVHATWTTDKDGTFVQHAAIRGIDLPVTSASKAIAVKAADGVVQNYTVTPQTVVILKSAGKHTRGTIADVKPGDAVGILGTGTGTLTATYIVDSGKPSTTTPKS